MTITSREVRDNVALVLDASVGASSEDFDVDGIVAELIQGYGLRLEYPDVAFWSIVQMHDKGRSGQQPSGY